MIDILGGMNTKEAVLTCIAVMVMFNALFVAGCIGLLNHHQTNKINLMKEEVSLKLEAVKGEILRRVNAFISHMEP